MNNTCQGSFINVTSYRCLRDGSITQIPANRKTCNICHRKIDAKRPKISVIEVLNELFPQFKHSVVMENNTVLIIAKKLK